MPIAFAQNFPLKPVRIVIGPGSDVLPRLAAAGLEPVANTVEEFAAFVRRDIAHGSKVVEQTGVKAD